MTQKTKIKRKGYYRKGYVRKDGTRVKGTYVKPRRVVLLPKPKRGGLSKYGYSSKINLNARRAALRKAVRAEGALRIYRRLNLIMVYNKNKNPALAKKFKADRNWVKNQYMK